MKSSSTAAAHAKAEQARVYRERLASLKDQPLLSIRDGAWVPVSELAAWLAPRANPNLVVQPVVPKQD